MLPTSTWRTSWPSAARASSSAAGRNRARRRHGNRRRDLRR